LESNLREPTLRHRFGTVLKELREKNKVLVDMLLMFAYVYQCRTPVSMDMLIAFLRDFTTDYREVYILRRQLGEMVADYLGPLADEEQDYFVTRSESLARAILENGKLEEIKHMLLKFHDQISPRRICHYDVFRRRAYDADIAMMAFADVEEGQDFYERMYQRDQSPYLLQQGALFLSRKQCYQEAFALIDEAILASGGKILSIRNSHAIILFRANIVFANDPEARGTLKRSMEILSECYSSDKRKMYHALAYSDQALQYARACPHDSYAMEFLRTAQKWLVEEEKYSPWSREIKRLRPMVERQLASLGG
jgi:tetratricopeptide (TPR) repeat protein